MVIMCQALSIWATLVYYIDWPTHGFAKIYLMATGLIITALVITVVLYTTGILAQCPAGFDVVQIVCTLCSENVVQPPLDFFEVA